MAEKGGWLPLFCHKRNELEFILVFRRFLYLRVVFVLALLSSFACVLGGNLLVNGNFAQKDEDGNALGWEVWPSPLHANAEVQLDNTNSHSAGQSMRISNKSELYSRIQQLNVPCKPHTRMWHRFSGDSIYTTRVAGL